MITDLPAYIAVASSSETVFWLEHAATFDEAVAWCERMKPTLASKVDQLAVARVHLVYWLRLGPMPVLAAARGWRWTGGSWQEVAPTTLNLTFTEYFPSAAEQTTAEQTPPKSYVECAAHIAEVMVALSRLTHDLHEFRRLMVTPGNRLRVLVVAESTRVRGALRKALQAEHDVLEANSFAEALVQLATSTFDAVVADDDMGSVGSGELLLAEARDRWPFVRRVLCSTRLSDLASRLEPGVAHRLLERPVDQARLLASLR